MVLLGRDICGTSADDVAAIMSFVDDVVVVEVGTEEEQERLFQSGALQEDEGNISRFEFLLPCRILDDNKVVLAENP